MRRHFDVDVERQDSNIIEGAWQHTEAHRGTDSERGDHPMNRCFRHVDVEDEAAVWSDVNVLPQPHVLVLTLDTIETPFSEVCYIRSVPL